jgi:hypothetical protein
MTRAATKLLFLVLNRSEKEWSINVLADTIKLCIAD